MAEKRKNIFQRIGGGFKRTFESLGQIPAWKTTLGTAAPWTIPTLMSLNKQTPPSFNAPGKAPILTSPTGELAPSSQGSVLSATNNRDITPVISNQANTNLESSAPVSTRPSGNEIDKFNLAVMDLLNKAKGKGFENQAELEKQRRLLMREQISRSRGEDSGLSQEERAFLSPSQQENMRQAGTGALSPDLDEIAFQLRKNELQQKNLDDLLTNARKYGDERLERELDKEKQNLELQKFDLEKQKFAETKRSNLATEAQKKTGEISPYQAERATRTIQSVDELMGQVNNWTTGWGSKLAGVPTTQAKNFRAQLDTLKASIAFNELTAMREASKTGGALGQVSNIELGLLENALAGLDRAQSAEQFKVQLQKVKDSVNRWMQAQGGNAGINNQPQTMILNGQTLTLQANGQYQ